MYEPLTGKVATGWTSVRGILSQIAGGVDVVKELLTSPKQYFSPVGAALGLIVIVLLVVASRFARNGSGGIGRHVPAQTGAAVSRLSRLWAWIVGAA